MHIGNPLTDEFRRCFLFVLLGVISQIHPSFVQVLDLGNRLDFQEYAPTALLAYSARLEPEALPLGIMKNGTYIYHCPNSELYSRLLRYEFDGYTGHVDFFWKLYLDRIKYAIKESNTDVYFDYYDLTDLVPPEPNSVRINQLDQLAYSRAMYSYSLYPQTYGRLRHHFGQDLGQCIGWATNAESHEEVFGVEFGKLYLYGSPEMHAHCQNLLNLFKREQCEEIIPVYPKIDIRIMPDGWDESNYVLAVRGSNYFEYIPNLTSRLEQRPGLDPGDAVSLSEQINLQQTVMHWILREHKNLKFPDTQSNFTLVAMQPTIDLLVIRSTKEHIKIVLQDLGSLVRELRETWIDRIRERREERRRNE